MAKSVGSGMMNEINEKELVKLMIEKASVFNYARQNRASAANLSEKPVYLKVTGLKTDVLEGVDLNPAGR